MHPKFNKTENRQKSYMNRSFLLGLLFALATGMSVASAGMPPSASLKLNQARFMMPTLVAYLDVRDANGKQRVDFSTGQFTASLGDKKLPVEQVQPFEKTGEGVATIFLVDVSRSVNGVDMRVLPLLYPKPRPESEPVRESKSVPTANIQNWAYFGLALSCLLLVTAIILALRRKPSDNRQLSPLYDRDGGKPGLSDKLPIIPKTGSSPSQTAEPCHVRLVRLGAGGHGSTYKLDISSEAIIGRKAECEVAIPSDTEISTRHCALLHNGRSIFLHDLGSTNGTRVNGVPITSDYRLQEGDIIGIGRTELRIFMS